jgi:type IV secretory pathway VirB2 component (pilin)
VFHIPFQLQRGEPVNQLVKSRRGGNLARRLVLMWTVFAPAAVFAQAAGSPFETGANSLVTFAQTIGTPIAALVVIGLAIAAAVGKVSWGWVVGAIVGIAALFGAPTIVSWIRAMFGV